jgi:hypothetical protein
MPLVQLIANCAVQRLPRSAPERTVNVYNQLHGVCNQLHGALTASGGVERRRSWFDNT